MMRGTEKVLMNGGCPYPGGAEVAFDQADVLQLGKLYCWGSACVQFIARLRDGREVFVRADRQAKDDERFLRRLAKPIRGWAPGSSEGFRTVWGARGDS
jgi:diadenosine tetraphosphatase ApaH/serine/threonine PP2A family protein phosphatase